MMYHPKCPVFSFLVSVATSKCREFQKTSIIRVQNLEVDKDEKLRNTKYNLQLIRKSTMYW